MTNPKSSPDQVTNPYASPRQLSGADHPAKRRSEDSRVYLELTPSCRAIFTLDLVGCVIRGLFLVIILLMLTQLSVKSRAEAPFFGWLACNAIIVVAGIIGDILLLNEHPAGRWWGALSVAYWQHLSGSFSCSASKGSSFHGCRSREWSLELFFWSYTSWR
jgi:hypothetical protein